MSASITTNGHVRDLIAYVNLPESARAEFDYIDGESDDAYTLRFFEYRGHTFDAYDFVRIESEVDPSGMRASFAHTVPAGHPLGQWVGIATDSHATATIFKWGTDWDGSTNFDTVVVGYYVA